MCMTYRYTVTKNVDESLAGVPGKLVLLFNEGSAMEVTPEDITLIDGYPLHAPSGDYVNYSYADGRYSCDCYGTVEGASAFSVVCYDDQDDIVWTEGNTKTNQPFKDWVEVLSFLLENHCDRIELIEAIHEGDDNA